MATHETHSLLVLLELVQQQPLELAPFVLPSMKDRVAY